MQKEYEYQALCVCAHSCWTFAQLANLDPVCTTTSAGLLGRVSNGGAESMIEEKSGNEKSMLIEFPV